jgi:hypothetical protein
VLQQTQLATCVWFDGIHLLDFSAQTIGTIREVPATDANGQVVTNTNGGSVTVVLVRVGCGFDSFLKRATHRRHRRRIQRQWGQRRRQARRHLRRAL